MISIFSWMLCLAPIGVYCLLIGWLHSQRNPMVLSGGRDLVLLGLALLGFVVTGPAELFFPNAAFNLFGSSVWVLILTLYLFILLFLVLNSSMRLIVYGLSTDQLANHVHDALANVDPTTKWMGTLFVSPQLGIEGSIEHAGWGQVCQIAATKKNQDYKGWLVLERALMLHFRTVGIAPRPAGKQWILLGSIILISTMISIYYFPEQVAQGIRDLLRL